MIDPAEKPGEQLRRRLQALGFDEVRFARLDSPEPAPLRAWLEQGWHADMNWMERTADKRLNPQLVLPGARSIIMLGVNYWDGLEAAGTGRPVWARYAQYEDYHATLKQALVAGGAAIEEIFGASSTDYRYYTDTGPVLERGWAERAGMGFVGKNGMLVSRHHGNWLLLAAILAKVELDPDAPLRPEAKMPRASRIGLLCGKCTRCMEACPTAAIPQPGVVDARRCISYQTIENKGIIPRELREGIGNRIYGCDVCLEVCPWNRFARKGRQMLLAAQREPAKLELRELLELTPERFAAVFRKTAIKRVKLAGILRNACVVAGNSRDESLLPMLVKLASHELAMVRAHAVWAVRRLAGEPRGAALLHAARQGETNDAVLAEYAG